MKPKILLGVVVGGFCSMVAVEREVEPTHCECYMRIVKNGLDKTVHMPKTSGNLERYLLQLLTGKHTRRLLPESLRDTTKKCYQADSELLHLNKRLRAHIVKIWETEDAGGGIKQVYLEIECKVYYQLLSAYCLEDSVYQLCKSVDKDFILEDSVYQLCKSVDKDFMSCISSEELCHE